MDKLPWPRESGDHTVHKLHDRDGNFKQRWFVSSSSSPGVFWLVTYQNDGPGLPVYFTCTCRAGWNGGRKMGRHWEPPCRHIKAVSAAEAADGLPPRPSAPPNISALVD